MLLVTRRLLLALQGNAKEELIQLATVPSTSRRRISRQDCGSPGIYPGPEKSTAIASSQVSGNFSYILHEMSPCVVSILWTAGVHPSGCEQLIEFHHPSDCMSWSTRPAKQSIPSNLVPCRDI